MPKGLYECPQCGETLREEPPEREPFGWTPPKEFDIFYAGVFVFFVGIVIAFGSWLSFAIPLPTEGNTNEFGMLNSLVALLGLILFVVGLAMTTYSFVRTSRKLKQDF